MRGARTTVMLLAIVGICAGTAMAQASKTMLLEVRYDIDRDNGSNSAGAAYPAEWHSNQGGGAWCRIKASDHQYYGDWDTAAMEADVTGPCGQLTTYGSYTPDYYLSIMPIAGTGWPDPAVAGYKKEVKIASVWSENDWVEGDGEQDCTNYNWTDQTADYAATYMYARDLEDASNPGSSDPSAVSWTFPGSTVGDNPPYPRFEDCTFLETFLDHGDKRAGGDWAPWMEEVKTIRNSASFMIELADEGNRIETQLDQAIIDDMLQNPDNRGIVLYNLPPNDFENTQVYTREQNAACWPVIFARIEVCSGDANLDCAVDGLDYVSWSNNYHQDNKQWEDGDFTGDGYVDGLDYIMWSNNYHVGCPSAPTAVPEPATMALLAIGGLALLKRRRRS